MASLRKKKNRRREMRDEKLAKRRQKKTRTRERKMKETSALFIYEGTESSEK